MSTTTAIVIGRNESARLACCLTSLVKQGIEIVYVDSGSTDDSVSEARAAGALVVELDDTLPFTPARARQAGFDRLAETGDLPEFVQFVDGDCVVTADWVHAGEAALRADPSLGLVTGWRTELYPERSVYNAQCDLEWRRAAQDAPACGGDMLVRSQAFVDAGGFDEAVIAGEKEEFCLRLDKRGWGLRRLPKEMTRHDASLRTFAQWWRRSVRNGYASALVGWMHPPYGWRDQLRALLYGAILPALALGSLLTNRWVFLTVLTIYLARYIFTKHDLVATGLPYWEAWRHARLLTLSHLPTLIGIVQFHWRRLKKCNMRFLG